MLSKTYHVILNECEESLISRYFWDPSSLRSVGMTGSRFDFAYIELTLFYIQLILNLLSYILSVIVLSLTFHDWIVSKRSRHRQKQSFCALLTSRKRHSSVTQNLPQTTCRPNIGGKRTRFSRINSNTLCTAQTAFALSPMLGRLFVVFLTVPVFYWN